jgi:hypothetical protein
MSSAINSTFVVKYDFYKNDIPQYAKVIIITLNNNSYLVEDINTQKRAWVMRYDIYPFKNHDPYGEWEFNEKYQMLF